MTDMEFTERAEFMENNLWWLLEGLLPGEHSIRFWINHAGG